MLEEISRHNKQFIAAVFFFTALLKVSLSNGQVLTARQLKDTCFQDLSSPAAHVTLGSKLQSHQTCCDAEGSFF